jgi:hypothetical protein
VLLATVVVIRRLFFEALVCKWNSKVLFAGVGLLVGRLLPSVLVSCSCLNLMAEGSSCCHRLLWCVLGCFCCAWGLGLMRRYA